MLVETTLVNHGVLSNAADGSALSLWCWCCVPGLYSSLSFDLSVTAACPHSPQVMLTHLFLVALSLLFLVNLSFSGVYPSSV